MSCLLHLLHEPACRACPNLVHGSDRRARLGGDIVQSRSQQNKKVEAKGGDEKCAAGLMLIPILLLA